MKLNQNDLEYLKDQMSLGKMTSDQANVEMVLLARVRVINSAVPAQVRKSLNTAVKNGQLSHMKKDGRKPEVYYHPSFEHLANQERSQVEKEMLEALAGIVARPYETYESSK